MADSTIVQIHKKIAELIGRNYAAGWPDGSSSHSGLNLTNSVVRGSVVEPPFVPYACVHFSDALEDYGPTMGRFSITAIFEIYVFAAGSSVADRSDASLNLVSDCIQALTADRSLGLSGLTDDIKCSFLALDGDRYGVDGVGIGYIKAEIPFQSTDGN